MAIPAPLENPVTTMRRESAMWERTSTSISAIVNASSFGPAEPNRPSLNAGPSLSGSARTSPASRVAYTRPVWVSKTPAVWDNPW